MILIITGPPASGKTTVGPLIAERLNQCAVIEVDILRVMVRQPHITPWLGKAGLAQLRLGALNGSTMARNCAAAGYDVVVTDVLTDETAGIYRSELAGLEHRIVLLLPCLEESLRRNRERGQFLTDEEVEILYGWQTGLSDFDVEINNTHIALKELAASLTQLISVECATDKT